MQTNSSLGQQIKRFRLMNDIRQEDMAEKMGVSRATLINYEKGYTTINVDVLDKLIDSYPNFSFDGKEVQKPKIIEDNYINFKVLANVLIKSKKYIIFITLLLSIIGGCTSFLFKNYYSAEISLYPAKKEQMQGLGQFQTLAANFGLNSQLNTQNFNIPDVVKSRLIADKAIKNQWISINGKKIKLTQLWGMDKQKWQPFFINSNHDSLKIHEKAIIKFHNHINVNEDRLTGLIRITSSFEDPNISASVANFIGEEVQDYIQRENSAQSKKEKIFISDRLLVVKQELEFAELKLKNFKERNRGYEESPDLFMTFSRLYREVEAKKEVYLTLQKQLELARIDEVKKSPILHVLDRAIAPLEKSSPRRTLFVIIFSLVGLVFSVIRVILRY